MRILRFYLMLTINSGALHLTSNAVMANGKPVCANPTI